MVFTCSVPGCKNTSKLAITHVLPRDPEIRKKWCQALNRMDLVHAKDRQRHTFRVCDIHFAEDVKFPVLRNRTNIMFNAIPTLHLGGKASERTIDFEVSAHSEKIQEETQYTQPMKKEHLDDGRQRSPVPSTSAAPHTPDCKGTTYKVNLLKTAGVTRISDLSPQAHKIYQVAKDLKKIANRLNSQNASNKERLTEALRYAESQDFLRTRMSNRALNFINCQIRMLHKNARGRRFTFDDKVFALSLLKQGPKAYRVLRLTFALPSRKTLMNILNKIYFNVGIMPKVMQVLKNSIDKMDFLDRHCTLMFDEISLEPSLTYDRKWDNIVGFEHINGGRRLKFADHALIFMLRGIRKKWKQPISFHFSQGGINADQLKVIIKNTILALQNIGFVIIATVCDQYASNLNAIKKLKLDSPRECASDIDIFEVGEQEIVGIYDPPHLLKGIRNNLVKNNLKFTMDDVQQRASWDDIVQLYKLDEGDFNTRMCYKLTDAHIFPEKMKKMKVKHASQVFSHRVSSTMRWTVKHGREGTLPASAEETARFLSFMDQVFDSVNGSAFEADHGKILRCAVKENSPHLAFWRNAINIFETIKYITPKGETVPPSVKNWIKTLRGFIYIWGKLHSIGFKYLCPRNINQDPLENFFGCIRTQGARNVNPTCYSFISAFKTLILNNFTSSHSPEANCDKDDGELLNCLSSLLLNNDESNEQEFHFEDDDHNTGFVNVEDSAIIATHAYIAGYIAKQIKKKIGNCQTCIHQLQASSSSEEHSFITELEYTPNVLLRPKTQFRRLFSNMVQLFLQNITQYILKGHIKKRYTITFHNKLYNPFLCATHNVFELCIEYFLHFFIHTYLKNINSILKGKIAYNIKNNDFLIKLAWQRHLAVKAKNRKLIMLKRLNL